MGPADPFPLSDVQQAYLIGRGDDFEISGVATHAYFEVSGRDLDLERLTDTWNAVVARNGMLRVVFGPGEEQRILPEVPHYEIATLDLRGYAALAAQTRLAQVRDELSHQVMPPDQWPLFDVRATLMPDGTTRLHISIDNLIADGASIRLILGEWTQRYRDPAIELPEQEFTYRDYLLAAREIEHTEQYAKAREYWLDRVEELPPGPALPLAVAPESVTVPRFTMFSTVMSEEEWGKLRRRAGRARVSASTVLLAAYAEVLASWSKTRHFTLTLTVFNKLPLHERVDELVGDFSSIALLELDLRQPASFLDRLRTIQAQLWRDLDHSTFGGVRVLREWARRQQGDSGSRMPVVFTSTLGAITDGLGFEAFGELVTAASQTPQVWLDSMVVQRPDGIALLWNFVTELFPAGLPEEMFTAYTGLLNRLVEDDDAWTEPHRDLRPAAHRREHEAANDTARVMFDLAPLHELFSLRRAERPDAPAVIAVDRTLTYRELGEYADAVSAELLRLGADTGDLVAVLMDKGWQQSAAVLGILQAGCAYLPISTRIPVARRELLLADGKVRATVTRTADTGLLTASTGPVVVVDELTPLADPPPLPVVGLDDLACVLYTSGTTGQPKGVMSVHGGIANTILDLNRIVGLSPGDRLIGVSELNFDMSMYDMFGAYTAGAALVVPDPDRGPDPAHWADLVEHQHVTVWNSVPAIAQLVVEQAEGDAGRDLSGLRRFLLGGDWIPVSLPGRIRACCSPTTAVTSIGGPTEASICQIYHDVGTVDPEWPSIPYGKPLANQHVYVLDEALQPRPTWVPGQLCVGGRGVGRGYWGDQKRTAERFITHPATGERLYLTGDMGRYRPGGVIEFLGREDTQVKIYGHRIELGEIEATLLRHPDVDQAAVTAPAINGRRRLVAYLATASGNSPDTDLLRAYLAEYLPPYMLPSTFVTLPALPLSVRGKVDRARLPVPVSNAPDGGIATVPRTEVERIIAREWQEMLDVPEVTLHDSFFDLGGDSLVATKIVTRLREALGVELRVREFFRAPTIAELAELVDARKDEKLFTVRVEPAARFEPFPLTDLQRALAGRSISLSGLTTHGYTEIAMADLDVDRLTDAWNRVVAGREALRAVFGPGDEGRILPETPRYEIATYDLRRDRLSPGYTWPKQRRPSWVGGAFPTTGDDGLSPGVVAHLERVREEMSQQVFAPYRWPLFDLRATLLPGGAARLHIGMDCLAADGTGSRHILRDLAAEYHATGTIADPTGLSLHDYGRGVAELAGTPQYAKASSYWLDRLDGLPAGPRLPLAGDLTGPVQYTVLSRTVPRAIYERLREGAARIRVSTTTVLVATLTEIIAGAGGDRHFTIPLTAFARAPIHPDVLTLTGAFTSVSLLEVDVRDCHAFAECATRIQDRVASDLDHGLFDGTRTLREWIDRDPAHRSGASLPVAFTSTLSVDAAPDGGFEGLGGLADCAARVPNVLLDSIALERAGNLVLVWTVAQSAFGPGTAEGLLDAWVGLLAYLAGDIGDRWQR
jgi:amino acid adenylation domain-containing protein